MATRSVYTNTIAQIAGKVATALISIFLIKILTNYLDVEGYGLYAKIYNYLSIFSVIADLGLYTLSVREMSKNIDHPEKVAHIAGSLLTLRTLLGIAIVFLSLGLAAFLPGYNSPVALVGVLIAGIFTLFGLMNSAILSVLQAYLKTEFSFVSVTVGKVVNFLAVLAVVWVVLPKPLLGHVGTFETHDVAFLAILGTGLLGNIVMTVLLYAYSRRILPIRFFWDGPYIKKLIRESLPYGLALFFNVLFFKVDVVMLSLLEAPENADSIVALYSLPMKIIEVGMMFGTVFLNSMLPLLTQSIHDTEKLRKLVRKSYGILLFFGGATAWFLTLKSEMILRLIASEKYLVPIGNYSSVDALQIVSFVFFLFFTSSLFNYLLIASGKQSRLLWINGGIALVNIIGNWILIPHYSFVGSSWATVVSQVLLVICTAIATRDVIRFDFYPRMTVGVVGILVVSAGCLMGLDAGVASFGGWLAILGNIGIHEHVRWLSIAMDLSVSSLGFGIPALGGFWILQRVLRKTEISAG